MKMNKIKKFIKEHSGVICRVGAIAGGAIALSAVIADVKKQEDEPEKDKISYDYGRDCLITFTVEGTGEVLWKEMCTESYVEDTKSYGMEYEAVRKLNGLE